MKLKYLSIFAVLVFILANKTNFVAAESDIVDSISCKVHTFLVDKSTKLPFKYTSPEIVNGSTIKTGDFIVYVFEINNNSSKESVVLKKVTAKQIEKVNEPIEIIQTHPTNGNCSINSNDKSIVCETNYSFSDNAHYPIEYLFKVTDNPNNYPKTSTLFDIETSAGNAQCASMIMIKKEDELNKTVVQTSTPDSISIKKTEPDQDDELEQINLKIENLNNKLSEQQTTLNKLKATIDEISNFLKRIFNSLFGN